MISQYIGRMLLATVTIGMTGEMEKPDVATVELSGPRKHFLLGEPVVLDLTVRNTTGTAIAECATPTDYVRILISRDGKEFRGIDQLPVTVEIALVPAVLEPNKPWHYRLRAFLDYHRETQKGADVMGLAFPEPGAYTVKVRFPLIGVVQGDYLYIESNPIEVRIDAPKRKDREISALLEDSSIRYFLLNGSSSGNGDEPWLKLVGLLERFPETGYGDGFRLALRDFVWRDGKPWSKSDPVRERMRRVLGEPDDRFFPDDPRLDGEVAMDFPQGTKVRDALRSLQDQIKVPLSGSPYFMRDSAIMAAKLTTQTRRALGEILPSPGAAWVRRGDGYYLYTETLDTKPSTCEWFKTLLGPVESIFPDDKRLDVDILVDFPEPTSIDTVIASYAKQSGVPLSASPFFKRCRQYGEKETLNLRSEMAYLARTFRASWERRGDGYFLNAGKDADEERVPPRLEPPKAAGRAAAILGGLVALALAVIAFVSRRNQTGRSSEKV